MGRFFLGILFAGLVFALLVTGYLTYRYRASSEMVIPIEELDESSYPDDPAIRSVNYGKYSDRRLKLVQQDASHFDFIFESDDPKVATIAFTDIDLSLFIPSQPDWITGDPDLEVVYYTEREWNRQQVGFSPDSPFVQIQGGDGFELGQVSSLELARNCLNAGFWEVQLFMNEEGEKRLYYHGWFNFPLGHYKRIFEQLNPVSYWSYWFRLEHWVDPQGTPVDFSKLRTVVTEKKVTIHNNPEEAIVALGEQARKKKTVDGEELKTWKDFQDNHVNFATFEVPGRYNTSKPWGNEFQRISEIEEAWSRRAISPANEQELDEIELVFDKGNTRLVIGGIDLDALPLVPLEEYSKGKMIPIGISLPPFYESYEQLQQNPPNTLPSYSLIVNAENEWLNHHQIAIDGAILFKEANNSKRLHIYLLSYERHALVGHYVIDL